MTPHAADTAEKAKKRENHALVGLVGAQHTNHSKAALHTPPAPAFAAHVSVATLATCSDGWSDIINRARPRELNCEEQTASPSIGFHSFPWGALTFQLQKTMQNSDALRDDDGDALPDDDDDPLPDEAEIERMLAEQRAKEEAERKAKERAASEDPSVAEYADACRKFEVTRCSQWQRACTSRAAEVSLSHYGLGKRGCAALASSLAMNAHVTALDLSDNGLGGEGVVAIVEALKSGGAPALRQLSLKQNMCGQEGAEAVSELLRSPHPLSSIDLGSNNLGSKGVATIADGLAENATLASLSLEHNDIDSEGVEKLVVSLASNETLTSLSLEWNNVAAPGGKALADGIIAGKLRLASLSLGWNGLGDAGAREIARGLEARPSEGPLRDVRLHHNRMSTAAAIPLSRCLGGLDALDVSGNALGSDGASVLLVAQQELRIVTDDATGDTSEHRCKLMMEDVCVRPDTVLAGLLLRTKSGAALSQDEIDASGVRQVAAAALRTSGGAATGNDAPRPASKSGGKKVAERA